MYDVCESTPDFNKFNFIKKFYTVSLSDTQSLCSCLTEYVVLWPKILFLLACVGHFEKKYSVKKDLSEVVQRYFWTISVTIRFGKCYEQAHQN